MKRLTISFIFFILAVFWCSRAYAYDPQASQIKTKTSEFSNNLSSSDTTVQKALKTLDSAVIVHTETDPIFALWLSTTPPLYSFTETDPLFTAVDHHANWDTAYGWGNHASAGYLTSSALTPYSTTAQADLLYKPIGYSPDLSSYSTTAQGDLRWLGIGAKAADSDKLNGQSASYYLHSFTEIDPVVAGKTGIITSNGSTISSITDNSSNWNTAYGWGNHALVGYVTGTPWTGMGYLTGITCDSPLSGAGTSASHLTIPKATNSVSGYLDKDDWTTFNNKLSSYAETDPIVKAINGIVKSNGSTISACSNLSDIAYQPQLNGTGFVKASGTTISYDNTRHISWSTALPLATTVMSVQVKDAITITKVTATCMGKNTPTWTFNIQERASNALNSAGTNVMTSSLVASATGANTTTFSNAGIAADAFMTVVASGVSGTVDDVVIRIDYTLN